MTENDQPQEEPEPIAGLRDASWASIPDRRGLNFWHISVGNFAGCNTTMPLMVASHVPAREILNDVRCKANGCAAVWATVPSRRYGDTLRPAGGTR